MATLAELDSSDPPRKRDLDGILEWLRTVFDASTGYLKQRHALLHVRDEKTSGTMGGTFTSGAWQTRVLNTVAINEITGASLASNQITLPAGTYRLRAWAAAYAVGRHKVKIVNVTDVANIVLGESSWTQVAGEGATKSEVSAQFTLTATKVLELRHRCESTTASRGFGVESSFDAVEVYAEVWIEKVA